MPNLTNELISLLQYLSTGFIVAWFIYNLTSREKPSQFERIVQALIYSTIVNILTTLTGKIMICLGRFKSLGVWNTTSALVCSLIISIIVGFAISFLINKDILHRLLRRFNITKKTSHPSNWHHVFSSEPQYIVLHFHDERRLYGWPLLWPTTGNSDYFHMTNCSWIEENQEENDTNNTQYLINANDVKWVEIVPKPEESQP